MQRDRARIGGDDPRIGAVDAGGGNRLEEAPIERPADPFSLRARRDPRRAAETLAALRAGALPKALNYLGVVMAAAGLFTIVPALEDVGIVFGLGLIVWLGWVGIVMYRGASNKA